MADPPAQQEQQRHLEQQLTQAQSRLETLEEFEASGEGYYQGVQQVLRAKKERRLSGIQGSILQLLEIPTEYLTAIENALGGAAQNVVVDDDRDAQQAIAWLKKERRGRVTFMPLNLVKGKRQDVDFHDDAVIGLALDLVQYDPKYAAVMAQLLGRGWVLRDLASATALAKRTGAKHRFVTLDGDVLAPGGSMTGGHQKKQSSIVHRKHEMGALKDKIAALTAEAAKIVDTAAKLQTQLEKLAQSQKRGNARKQEEQLALREIAVVLEQQQAQVKRVQRELELERMNRDSLSAERATAEQDLARAKEAAEALSVKLETLAQDLAQARSDLGQAETAQQTAQAALQGVLVQQAARDEQVQHQRERHAAAVSEAARLQQAVAQQETDSAQLAEELASLSARLDDERTALKTAQDSHFAVDATLL